MSWLVSPWVYPVWDSMCLLDLIDYVVFHVGEIFNCNPFKNFPMPSFSLFCWDAIIQILVHLIFSQRSLRLASVLLILFTLFCSQELFPPLYLPAPGFVPLPQMFCYLFLLDDFILSNCFACLCTKPSPVVFAPEADLVSLGLPL